MDEAEAQWRAERGGGNYGAGTKEMQERNYITKKEAERKRREVFNDGMQKFGSGKIEEVMPASAAYSGLMCLMIHVFNTDWMLCGCRR